MAVQTDAREEALRRAREEARLVLAKHPCVTAGGEACGEDRSGVGGPGPVDPAGDGAGDRRDAAGDGGS